MHLLCINPFKIFFSIQGIGLFVKGRVLYINSGALVFGLVPHLAEHQVILDYNLCRNPPLAHLLVAGECRSTHKLARKAVVFQLANQVVLGHPDLYLRKGDTLGDGLKIKYSAVELSKLLLLYTLDFIVACIVGSGEVGDTEA